MRALDDLADTVSVLNPASTRKGWFKVTRVEYGGLKRSETERKIINH